MQLKVIHKNILRRHHLFARMSEEQLTELMNSAITVKLEKSEYLFLQGEPAERFYFVISGRVKLFRMLPEGVEKVIEVFGPSDTFAEALMFHNAQEYPVSAQAMENCELFSFSNKTYKHLVRSDSQLALELLAELSFRLHKRLHEIEVLSLRNSSLRVVRYLLSLIETEGGEDDSIELPIAKKLIAAHLAVQPETLSRIFNRMKEEGVVEMKGRYLRVTDLEKFKRFE